MKLYLKQHVFAFGDQFTVYDEKGNDRFYVDGEVFTFGKKLHIKDLAGNELIYIEQKVFSFLPTYHIYRGDVEVAEVVKEFAFFRHEYSIGGLNWHISGDVFDHEYSMDDGQYTIATVSKEWFTRGDAYEIDVHESVEPVLALAVALVIDACMDSSNN
jgi:uncharacterized protein YxjI